MLQLMRLSSDWIKRLFHLAAAPRIKYQKVRRLKVIACSCTEVLQTWSIFLGIHGILVRRKIWSQQQELTTASIFQLAKREGYHWTTISRGLEVLRIPARSDEDPEFALLKGRIDFGLTDRRRL